MLEYVHARQSHEFWTAEDIREDSPEDAELVGDADVGVCFHSGDGDGALIIGTPGEIIERLEAVIRKLRDR